MNMALNDVLLRFLGMKPHTHEVSNIKTQMKLEVQTATRKINKLNRILEKQNITLDISRAIGGRT